MLCVVMGQSSPPPWQSHPRLSLVTRDVPCSSSNFCKDTLSSQLSDTTGDGFPFLISCSPKSADNSLACTHSVLPFSSTTCLCSQSCEGKEAVPWPEPQDWSHIQPTLGQCILFFFFFLFFRSFQGFCIYSPKCRKFIEYKLSSAVSYLWRGDRGSCLCLWIQKGLCLTLWYLCFLTKKRELRNGIFCYFGLGKEKPLLGVSGTPE